MRTPKLCLVTLAVGVALVAVSLVIPWIFGPRTAWTEQQALQHAQAAGELHSLAHRRGQAENAQQAGASAAAPQRLHNHHHDDGPPPSDQQITEARERFDRSKAQLQQARRRGSATAAVLRSLGVVSVLVGGGGYLLLRRMA